MKQREDRWCEREKGNPLLIEKEGRNEKA